MVTGEVILGGCCALVVLVLTCMDMFDYKRKEKVEEHAAICLHNQITHGERLFLIVAGILHFCVNFQKSVYPSVRLFRLRWW